MCLLYNPYARLLVFGSVMRTQATRNKGFIVTARTGPLPLAVIYIRSEYSCQMMRKLIK